MPLFRGFKFSFNVASGKQLSEFPENDSPVSIKGAYKLNTEEFLDVTSYADPPKKITPSMVKLPPAFQPDPTDPDVIRATKSTSNLTDTQPANIPPTLRKSTPEVSSDPRGGKTKNRDSADVRKPKNKTEDKEQKRLEKKRQDEQKKREKIEAQERAKQQKIEKQREKAEAKERERKEKSRKTETAKASKEKTKKTPEVKPRANPLAQGPSNLTAANPLARNPYNSNTLQSSISKTSGPPPYNEITDTSKTIVQNERDDTGNTSFGKPIDEGSTWDMVAQHKAQISRTPAKSRVQLLDSEPNAGRKSLEV